MLCYFATSIMMQSNNADLGKAFPGGMVDMALGKASFFVFRRAVMTVQMSFMRERVMHLIPMLQRFGGE